MDQTNEDLRELVAVQTRTIEEMQVRMGRVITEKAAAEVRAMQIANLHVMQAAAEAAQAGAPEAPVLCNAMCERKTDDIMQRDGYAKTGYVLMTEDPAARICVSDQGAVAWFTRDEWNWLMHNRDHIEFAWPKPVGAPAAPAAPVGTVDTPEFCDLITELQTAHGFICGDKSKVAWSALIAHIDAHTAAAVAQATKEKHDALGHMTLRFGASVGAHNNAVRQAQQHAMEARTQRGTVLDILRHFGCAEEDWRALALIKGVVAAKQAVIDRLMLEYCPCEMSAEQMATWKSSQHVAPQQHAQAAQQTGARKIGITEDGLAALSGAEHFPLPLTDDQVIGVLHSCGIDTYPSLNGFASLQVSATSVPWVREVVRRCMVLIEAADSRVTGNAQAALSDDVIRMLASASGEIDGDEAEWSFTDAALLAFARNLNTRQPAPVDRAAIHRKVLESDMDGPDVIGPTVCTVPPAGWYCTRPPGHDGPCAAHPVAPVASAPAVAVTEGSVRTENPPEFYKYNPDGLEGAGSRADLWAYGQLVGWRTGLAQRAASQPDSERDAALREVHAFLLGEGALCHMWFGQKQAGQGEYWWRKNLRDALGAQPHKKD